MYTFVSIHKIKMKLFIGIKCLVKQSRSVILQDVWNSVPTKLVTCESCVCETLVEASECVPQSAPRSASSASVAVFVLASFCASSLILPSTTAWIDLEPNADYEVHILRPSHASFAQFAQVRRPTATHL